MAGPSSPQSPQDGLRKRGRQPSVDLLHLGSTSASASPQATTKNGHRRTLTASSDEFGAFVDPPLASFDSPSHAADMGFDDEDEQENDEHWHDADMVHSFSPDQKQPATVPASFSNKNGKDAATAGSTAKGIGSAAISADLLDWDAWDTPKGLQSVTPGPGTAARQVSNTADEDFFAAFEKAAISRAQRQPSPPMIDLREMEKQLSDRKKQQGRMESDFFATFEESPEETMRGSARKIASERSPGLMGTRLDDMKDAQESPMHTTGSTIMADYFGTASKTSEKDDDFGDDEGNGRPKQDRSDSWSEMAGSWSGSLRKTLGSLRGLPAEVVNHLPSASDFIVPPEEGQQDQRQGQSQAGPFEEPEPFAASSSSSKPRKQSIASASDYSHGTPFGASGTSPTSPRLKPIHSSSIGATTSGGSSGGGSTFSSHYSSGATGAIPISGAPGFDASSTRRWNTGDWSLSAKEESLRSKRPMPVTLRGRRPETNEVIEDWHAARLQPHLPPRLQLGKSWKLLYSSDQHGISLGTLYRSVESGMSASAGGQGLGSRVSSGSGGGAGAGVAEGEGWLRGASGATKAALMGSSQVKRVGGGLMSLADAGLIVAVRDAEDNVFGAFINERIRPQAHYYGSGECFLWKTTNLPPAQAALHHEGDETDDRRQKISIFGSTGKNDYMALTEARYLSFGGGEGKYGFWLDGSLDKGISATCPAFDNEVLCNSSAFSKDEDGEDEGKFECICIEVWACGID